MNARI